MKCPHTNWIQTLALAVLAALAWTAGADTLNNPCTPDEPQPNPCWEWDEEDCVWVYCPDAKPGEVCCVVDGACKICDEKDKECCEGDCGTCKWGGGKGTAKGSGSGPSGTRAAGGGAQGVVDFQIKLGTLPGEDAFAAIARVRTELPATNWAGAAGLQVLRHGRAEIEVVRGSNGVERIYAPEMDAGVVADAGGRNFELRCWPRGEYGQGTPPVSWRVEAAADGAWVRFTKFADGATNSVTEYAAAPDGNGLVVTEGDGLRRERVRVELTNGFLRADVHEVSGPDGVVARMVRKYERFFFGDRLVEEWTGADGGEILVRALEYGTNRNEKGSFGRVVARRDGDGGWTRWEYDLEGRTVRETSGWGDAEEGAAEETCRVVETSYAPEDAREWPVMGDKRWRRRTERVCGVWQGTTWRAFFREDGADWEIEEEAASGSSAYGAAANRRTVRKVLPAEADARVRFQPLWERSPEGREDAWEYGFGSYVLGAEGIGTFAEGDGTSFVRVAETRGTNWLETGRSVRTVRVLDAQGREVQEESWVYAGGGEWSLMDWTATVRDGFGRVTERRFSDGNAEAAGWACCGKDWERAADGREWSYTHDLLGRVTSKSQTGGPTEFTEYDAAGRVTARRRTGGGLSLATSNRWDLAGRLVASFDEAGLETAFAHGTRTETVTLPGGATRTTERLRDGRVRSVTGTAGAPRWHEYGVLADGGEWEKTWMGVSNGPAWELTVRDRRGRTVRTERPAFGGGVATNGWDYDAAGRLVREWATGEADRLYVYDEHGELLRSGIDADGDGELTLDSMDRLREERTRYVELGAAWYAERTSVGYPWDNSSVAFTNGIVRTPVCRSGEGRTETVDARGWTSAVVTVFSPATRTVTRTSTRPEVAGAEVSVTSNGLLRVRTDPTGATWRYLYDGLGRTVGVIDPRTGTNTVAYAADGRVVWHEDAAGNRTSYGYDPATGLRTSVTNALGQAVQSSFNARGQLTAVWGDAYPITYEYDGYGRMVLMKTWKDGNGTPEETRWHFDEATGLLTNKVHTDGLGPSYEYDARGRTTMRTWARGVETVYSHDALGQVTNVHYSDGTPDWNLAYDRQGRIIHASNAFGTWSNSYGVLELLEERFPDGSVVVRSHDACGRPSNLSVDSDYSVDYAFDPLGRLDSVSPAGGEPFLYDYLENSTTIAGWRLGSNAMQVAYFRETNRDIRTGVGTFWGGTPVWRSDDTFDAAGRNILQENGDGASSVTNAFAYNSRSELVSAQMGTNRYGYAYDAIGNRTAATNNATAVSYIANDLNQYTLVPEENRSFQYDPDGNLVSDGEWTYSWDAENRLVAASNASFAITFEYDYLGRRIGKTVNGIHSSFVYDGWSLLRETTGTNVTHYVWGADVSQRMQGAGDIGGLLCVRVDGTPYYPCADGSGNIVGYVDGTGATVVRREYSPFGETTAETGTAPAGLRIWFSSKYLDEEMGLYYYGYRYYHPGLGRWLSRDPVHERGGFNMYEFEMNSPNIYYDALGNLPHRRVRVVSRYLGWHNSMFVLQNTRHSTRNEDCKYCGPDVTGELAKELNDALERWAFLFGEYTDSMTQFLYYRIVARWFAMLTLGPHLDFLATKYDIDGICPLGEGCERTYWICGKCVHDHFVGNIMYGYWMRLFGFRDVTTLAAGHFYQLFGHSDDGTYSGAFQLDLPYDQAGYELGWAFFETGMTGFTADSVCDVIKDMDAFQRANETGEDYSSCQQCPY